MYCLKCGALLNDGDKYCLSCGNELKDVLNITYDDPIDSIEDPVILSSHTFNDHELPSKINDELSKEKKTINIKNVLLVLIFCIFSLAFNLFTFIFY